ncbi:hypothetical protein P4V04_23435, partial [Bacillus subtilis]|nr:hypothetical protein [Bacillus subtilis]
MGERQNLLLFLAVAKIKDTGNDRQQQPVFEDRLHKCSHGWYDIRLEHVLLIAVYVNRHDLVSVVSGVKQRTGIPFPFIQQPKQFLRLACLVKM